MPNRLATLLLLALLASAAIGACGQKGPLQLPADSDRPAKSHH